MKQRTSSMQPILSALLFLLVLGLCFSVLLEAAAYPFARFHILTAIDTNEGWNVFNAQTVAEHRLLYPPQPSWTVVNYPALSFHLVAALGRSVSDYLFIGRTLSLLSLCGMGILVGMIVWQLTRKALAATLAASFMIALFCAFAPRIVGMDDPQILAQVFFLTGLYIYLRGGRRGFIIESTALLFVLGGNIKHNLIEFPLAVFLDLLFTARRAAIRFALELLGMAGISVFLTSYLDGGGYLSCLLAPRAFSVHTAIVFAGNVVLSMLVPSAAAVYMVPRCWQSEEKRILVFFFFSSVLVDTVFAGGDGVDINIFFGYTLAVALFTGMLCAELPFLLPGKHSVRASAAVYSVFFLWLGIKIIHDQRDWPLQKRLESDKHGAQRLALETEFTRRQPGEAICMDLLVCAFAGKAYLYDSANVDRYVRLGWLDPEVTVKELKDKKWAAVQIWGDPNQILTNTEPESLFAPSVRTALSSYYRPGLVTDDGVIYIPADQSSNHSP